MFAEEIRVTLNVDHGYLASTVPESRYCDLSGSTPRKDGSRFSLLTCDTIDQPGIDPTASFLYKQNMHRGRDNETIQHPLHSQYPCSASPESHAPVDDSRENLQFCLGIPPLPPFHCTISLSVANEVVATPRTRTR